MIDAAMLNRLITQVSDPNDIGPWNYSGSVVSLSREEVMALAKAIWSEAVASERAK